MAGRGRGRGRGAVASPPGKPGGGGGSPKDPMEQLDAMVKSLSLDADDKEIIPIKETATKASTTKERMEEVFTTVYQRCQEDWRFSPTAAKICCKLITDKLEVEGGVNFRTLMIQTVQADFKNKDKTRTESPQKFLGSVSMLCQIYAQMRDEKGEPFKPLTTSIMESLEMLLEEKATDEEMWCAAEQLYGTGKILQQCVDKIRITSLRNKVKDKIIHAVGSKEVRTELIKVVEGFASDWKHYS